MRFGKRRKETDAPDDPAAASDSTSAPPPPVSESWTGAPAEQHYPAQAPEEPVAAAEQAYEEPVVEGEAIELPSVGAAEPELHQPVPRTIRQSEPRPEPMPFPVAEQPVGVVTPGATDAPVTSLGESAEAFASGHAPAPGPSWQEPVMDLAHERPELVVGAAFAGGVLAAMILRRLAN